MMIACKINENKYRQCCSKQQCKARASHSERTLPNTLDCPKARFHPNWIGSEAQLTPTVQVRADPGYRRSWTLDSRTGDSRSPGFRLLYYKMHTQQLYTMPAFNACLVGYVPSNCYTMKYTHSSRLSCQRSPHAYWGGFPQTVSGLKFMKVVL